MTDAVTVAILAGGLGTRLGELTRDLPKPMIPIGGRPYLERVIESFSRAGFHEFVLLTGYRAEVIEGHFGDGSRFGIHIRYSREQDPLGTGGAIREAAQFLGSRFVMTYGDVLRYFDYDRFVTKHDEPCVAVYPSADNGNTAIQDDRVARFDKHARLPYMDAGFSLMSVTAIDLLPSTGPCSFEESVFPRLAAERRLACEVVDLHFFDIGTPDELARTKGALEGGTL